MSLEDLKTQLETILDVSKPFQSEHRGWAYLPDKSEPSKIIIELEEKGLKFEQKHFDKYINGLTSGKSGSYIIGWKSVCDPKIMY